MLFKSSKFPIFLAFGLILLASFACKKAVDQVQQNALYDIITNGRWKVTKFDVGTTPKQAEYEGYEFQFYSNGVVKAFKSGSPDVNGTWDSNIDNLTITSNFPGTTDPLKRFNGIWFITRTTEVTVQAVKSEGTEEYSLALRKL
jgi:hypothetical protein